MTCYVAWYGKKRSRLAEREAEFLQLLDACVTGAPLDEAVETIRAAHLRALREKRAKFAPSEKNAAVLGVIEDDLRRWSEMSRDAIVEGYRKRKTRHAMSSAVRWAVK